jgi:hypothetical protein
MKVHLQVMLALVISAALLLSGCGPDPKPQAKPEDTQEQAKAAPPAEERPVAAAPVEEPRPQVAAKPKPVAKPAPKADVTSHQPAQSRTVNTPKPADSRASNDTASSDPRGLTLPTPVAPPIAPPVPPPADDVKPIKVDEPPPAPKEVTVPSGTLVAVRMIDSVDSETSKLGESFKASLDAPITIDNDTVFPKGSEVYVKLTKVQAAGRVSGKSEVQLQLDRIFLGKKSYLLESSTYASTGASQSGRTARSAGLGAAIGAAIGAISGGGKGAVIGGATGAGAGAGVEAIRKGEQVKVDSETRLEFRLESPLNVTLQSPSTNQRNNPSGPLRFGTRP